MIRNIIFDWSGTLVDDLPAVWEATNYVFEKSGVAPLTLDGFRSEFCLPFQKFYERFTPHVELPKLEEWYHGRFREVQDRVRELPHARAFLEFCRTHQRRTFLLSTIHRDHFAQQTASNRFHELLDRPYVEAWDKKEHIHRVLKENQLDPQETIFVGDMEHDVETAHHAGIYSCAVLTGYNRVSQLRSKSPHLIVEHLGELQRLFQSNGFHMPSESASNPGTAMPIATVGALILDPAGNVLLIQTHKWSHLWGIPGGKIKFGEPSESALRRELKEETNLDIEDIQFVLVQDCIHSQEFYRDAHFVLLNYTCRTQTPANVILNEEAQTFRWVSPQEALTYPLNQPTRILLEHVLQLKS